MADLQQENIFDVIAFNQWQNKKSQKKDTAPKRFDPNGFSDWLSKKKGTTTEQVETKPEEGGMSPYQVAVGKQAARDFVAEQMKGFTRKPDYVEPEMPVSEQQTAPTQPGYGTEEFLRAKDPGRFDTMNADTLLAREQRGLDIELSAKTPQYMGVDLPEVQPQKPAVSEIVNPEQQSQITPEEFMKLVAENNATFNQAKKEQSQSEADYEQGLQMDFAKSLKEGDFPWLGPASSGALRILDAIANEENAGRAAADIGLGAVQTGINMIPAINMLNMIDPFAQTTAKAIGESIGGEKGKEYASTATHYLEMIPFGSRVLIGMVASELGKEGVQELMKLDTFKDIPQEDKDRIAEGTGHLAFFAGMGAAGKGERALKSFKENLKTRAEQKRQAELPAKRMSEQLRNEMSPVPGEKYMPNEQITGKINEIKPETTEPTARPEIEPQRAFNEELPKIEIQPQTTGERTNVVSPEVQREGNYQEVVPPTVVETKPAAEVNPGLVREQKTTDIPSAKTENKITVYRGAKDKVGNWFTPDKSAAGEYSKLHEKGKVTESAITPKKLATNEDVLRIAKEVGLKDADQQAEYHLLSPEIYEGATSIISELKKQGYDYVKVNEDFSPSGKQIESYLSLKDYPDLQQKVTPVTEGVTKVTPEPTSQLVGSKNLSPETNAKLAENQKIIDRIFELKESRKTGMPSEKRSTLTEIMKEVKKLRQKGINVSYRSDGLSIDGQRVFQRQKPLPVENIKDVKIDNKEASKPFEKLPNDEVDKQTMLAEFLAEKKYLPEDLKRMLPNGFGQAKLDKAISDIKKDAGAEQTKEAQILRDFTKEVEKRFDEDGYIEFSNKQKYTREEMISDLEDFATKRGQELGGEASFDFGANKGEIISLIEKTAKTISDWKKLLKEESLKSKDPVPETLSYKKTGSYEDADAYRIAIKKDYNEDALRADAEKGHLFAVEAANKKSIDYRKPKQIFTIKDIDSGRADKIIKENLSQEKTPQIEKTKAGDQYTLGAEMKPSFPTKAKFEGKTDLSEETPLFQQEKVDKGQIDAFEQPKNINAKIKSDMPKGTNAVKVEYESGKSALVTKQDVDTIVEPRGDKIKNITYGNVEFNKQGGMKAESFKEKVEITNKVFTEDRYKKARENVIKKGQQLTSGIDPTLLKDYVDIAGYHIEKGARTFTEYSKQMIDDLGEKIRPHLQRIWNEIKNNYPDILKFSFEHAEKLYDSAQKTESPYREWVKQMRKSGVIDEDLRTIWDEIKTKKSDELLIKEDVGLDKRKIELKSKAYLRQQKKETKSQISDIIFKRRSNIDTENFKSSLFVHGLETKVIDGRKISKEQLEVIPFLIEKTDIPKGLERTDLEKIYSEQKEKLMPIAKEVSDHFDAMWEKIVANTDKLSTDQIENYVTHIWEIPKGNVSDVTNWFTTKNRFLNKRYIETIKEGIDEFGLKPKTLNIADIIRIHDKVANNAIENAKFVNDLKTLQREGLNLIQRSDKAPPEWAYIDHPALTTSMFIPGDSPGSPSKLVRMPLKVHPDLKAPLEVIFGKRFTHPVIKVWESIDSILKKTALSVSLFHHGALIETGVAFTNPLKVLKLLGKETIGKGLKQRFNENPLLSYPEETIDAMKHGVQFGHTLDINVSGIQKGLNVIKEKTKNVPIANLATKFLSTFNQKWDSALWNYIHDPLKLYAYIDAKAKMPKDVNPENYLRTQAQLINDTFGGQNWETLMVSPKTQQVMRWFLLSPDWTVSTIRQALSVTGFGGRNPEGRRIRAKSGTKFWLKAGVYFGTGINLLNSYYRKQDEQEHPEYYKDKKMDFWDYTMFGNSIGHKTHLFTGRYEDGSERYLRWGKQFRELPELIMDEEGVNFPRPLIKKIGGKSAPLIQLGSKVFTGKTLSGYDDWNVKDKKGWDYTLGLMKTIGESVLPFSSQAAFRDDKDWTPTDLMMPSSKGMTKSKAILLFKKAIIQNDVDYIKEIYSGAVKNNLEAFGLFKAALASVKAEGTKELMEDVRTIDDAKSKLKTTRDKAERDKLESKIKRFEKEIESKNKGFKGLNDAIKIMDGLDEDKPESSSGSTRPSRPSRPSRSSRSGSVR